MKSEPQVFGIGHLEKRPDQTEPWDGVRNYQARNFMRDQMKIGDLGIFYHSSCPTPGFAGLIEVVKESYPDATQFDPTSKYYDPKSTTEKPRWFNVDVKLVRKIKLVPLKDIRENKNLTSLQILRRGNRLSITPISPTEWLEIQKMIT